MAKGLVSVDCTVGGNKPNLAFTSQIYQQHTRKGNSDMSSMRLDEHSMIQDGNFQAMHHLHSPPYLLMLYCDRDIPSNDRILAVD